VLAEFLQTMLVDIFNSVEQGVLATFFSASICQLVALLISSPGPRPRHCWLESSSSQPADELLRDALLGTAQASTLKQRPDGPKQPRDITYTLLAHLVTLLPSFRHSTSPLPALSLLHCIKSSLYGLHLAPMKKLADSNGAELLPISVTGGISDGRGVVSMRVA
jgi:hypothetical protein